MNKTMKRFLLTIIIAVTAVSAYAQPRAMGIRFGATGFEADYQHEMKKNQFIEGNLGMDFGALAKNSPGIKATAVYNFIWARPAWTNEGTWAIYAGPGASIGYVYDSDHQKDGLNVRPYHHGGFMLGICGQVGVEYSFWFPLQLSVDLRPTIGMHVGGKGVTIAEGMIQEKTKVGLYDGGFLGFVPSLSVRYKF